MSSSVLASYTLSWSKMRTQFKASFKDGLIPCLQEKSTEPKMVQCFFGARNGKAPKRAISAKLTLASRFLLWQKCEPNLCIAQRRVDNDFEHKKSKHQRACFFVVRETGIEPVWHNHTPLKRARLPIPPLSHI